MRRWCLAHCLLLIASCSLFADAGDPYTYVPVRHWGGKYIGHPADTSRGIVIQHPSVWSTTQAPLLVISGQQEEGRSFAEAKLMTAAYVHGKVLVVLRSPKGIEAALYDADVKTRLSAALLNNTAWDAQNSGQNIANIHVLDSSSVVCLQVGAQLFTLDVQSSVITARLLENNVVASALSSTPHGWELQYVHTVGASAFLSIYDQSRRVVETRMIPYSKRARMERRGGAIAVVADLDDASSCVITIVERSTMAMRSRSLPVPSAQITLFQHENNVVAAIVTSRSGRAELIRYNPFQQGADLPKGEFIPGDFGSPYSIVSAGDTLCLVFSGGIVIMTIDGSVLSRDAVSISKREAELVVEPMLKHFVMRLPQSSYRYQQRAQPLWFIYRGVDLVLRYVLPLLFIGSLGFVWILNRRQRRLLDAIIDSPATGLVLTIDNSGRLVRTNERASAVLRIMPNVPMRRHFRAYMQQAGLEQLVAYLDSIGQSRIEPNKRITLQVGEEQREYICSMTPLVGMFGGARGAIISAVDITETLEQRRLVNWAQLAHDMQTNLSTIRLNAEQLPAGEEGATGERRRRILFQVGVLIDRVRDLLSIGRTDDVSRSPVHSAELCTEVRHEFDSEMFPHVKFSMKLRGTMMNVDRLKVSRAIRNAVENAIKALRGQEGVIEIATWHDRTNVFISVSDTGVGMDPETMANMMKPYFSTAQDGSGHGIGTMIMHHVVKLHGGAIRVTSEPGKGTQVIFRIPHEMDPKDVLRLSANDR